MPGPRTGRHATIQRAGRSASVSAARRSPFACDRRAVKPRRTGRSAAYVAGEALRDSSRPRAFERRYAAARPAPAPSVRAHLRIREKSRRALLFRPGRPAERADRASRSGGFATDGRTADFSKGAPPAGTAFDSLSGGEKLESYGSQAVAILGEVRRVRVDRVAGTGASGASRDGKPKRRYVSAKLRPLRGREVGRRGFRGFSGPTEES